MRSALPIRVRPRPTAGPRAGLLLALLATGPGVAAQAVAPRADERPAGSPFGDYAFELTGLRAPAAVAIGPDDAIYVADAGQDRIRVFDAAGQAVRTWGRRGAGPSGFRRPGGVAVGPDGEVFVADSGNHRIQVFSSTGVFKREWGGYGTAPGRFIDPRGLAVGRQRVYVADTGNDRVQVFDRHGQPLRAFGTCGTGEGELRRPADVAPDDAGFVYVADRDNQRVVRFDKAGRFVQAWGRWGPFPGMMADPGGLACHDGRLYVAETKNHRVQVFASGGTALYQWGLHAFRPREGAGKLHYPVSVAVAPSGRFAVVCEAFEDRCQVFRPMPPGESPAENPFLGMDMTGSAHFGRWADASGSLLACSELETDKVVIYDTSRREPILIGLVGSHGTRPGRFIRPSGLDIDAGQSLLYVADAGNRRIQMFRLRRNPPGEYRFIPGIARFVRLVDLAALRAQKPALAGLPVIEPGALRRDRAGRVYVLDRRQGLVVVFDEKLNYLRHWGGPAEGAGGLRRPTDLAIGPGGDSLLVVDAAECRVRVFRPDGTPTGGWPVDGGRGGAAWVEPFGIAVGAGGCVYVTDAGAHRVARFDEGGRLLGSWGTKGLGAGEMFKPAGIVLDARQRLTVIDYGNHRGDVFTQDGGYVDVFGSRFFIRPARRARPAARDQ